MIDGTTVSLLVGFIAAVVILLTTLLKTKRPANSPPIAHAGIPLIGNYIEFGKNPVKFVQTCKDKFGSVFTVPMLHKNLTFLVGPEASAPFFQLGESFMSQSEVYGFMTPVFGTGVVYDAEPKKRNQQMQTMTQGLKSIKLHSYPAKIEKEVDMYCKKWGQTGSLDILEAMSELTILTSSRCLHGDDVRENMFEDVSRIFHDLDKGVTPLSFFFPYAPTQSHRLRDAAREEMVKIFSKIIRMRKEQGGDTSQATDILQLFIDLEYKEGGGLEDHQVVGLLIALLFAGQHTSTISSSWVIMALIHHPECMERVMAEQREVSGEGWRTAPLDFESVGKMEYLQNCVKEVLRLYPPLILLMRMAMADIETTDETGRTFTIPKGDIVLTSPAVAGRLETVFKNADKFEPDRFGPERNEQKTPYAYLGFGAGRHACLGQQFGLLQVKTIVSILVRRYHFAAVDREFPQPDFTAMVVGPMNHTRVTYTVREE